MIDLPPHTAHSDPTRVPDILRRITLLPEVRDARIQELRFMIETGLYTIDPLRIAKGILSER